MQLMRGTFAVLHGSNAQREGSTGKVLVTLHKHKWRVSVVWFGGGEAEDGKREVGRGKTALITSST